MKRFSFALFSALMLALMLAGSALAHAKFDKSDPAPDAVLTVAPTQVTIWFTEEIDTRQSNIKVFDAANAQVDLGNSKVNLDNRKQLSVGLKPLTNGVYTVKWHNVSTEDGDPNDGEFRFTVRAPTTPTAPPTVAPTLTATPTLVPSPTRPPVTTVVLTSAPTRLATVPAPTQAPWPTPVPAAAPASDFTPPFIVLSLLLLGVGTWLVLRRR